MKVTGRADNPTIFIVADNELQPGTELCYDYNVITNDKADKDIMCSCEVCKGKKPLFQYDASYGAEAGGSGAARQRRRRRRRGTGAC